MNTNALPWIEPLESRIVPAGAVFELSSLNGSNGFHIGGDPAGVTLGYSVSAAGDVNGDGFDDVIISDAYANVNGDSSGAAYVVFGGAGGFPVSVNLSTLDGSNGFRLVGEEPNDRVGRSASGLGDINGDGFDDIIVGAPFADRSTFGSAGASYVIFGRPGGFAASIDLATLNGTNGFKISGAVGTDISGISVSGAGDVNGDGLNDIIVGAPRASPNGYASGSSFVIFGQTSSFGSNVNLGSLDGRNGFRLNGGTAGDYSGYSVSGAGDVNGDGFDDIIVGAISVETSGITTGAAYVVLGRGVGFPAAQNLANLTGSNGFRLNGVASGDTFGYSVSGAGDINGDGIDDLIIGALNSDPNGTSSGASYVVFGRRAFTLSFDVAALDGTNGFRVSGAAAGDLSGASVSGAGDINNDGFDDLIVGAPQADPNGDRSGAAYVVFGTSGGFGRNLNLSALDGNNGYKINGIAVGDRAGFSVSGAGDVNRDGFADLVVGARSGDPNGAGYVVFGRASQTPPTVSVDDIAIVEGGRSSVTGSFEIKLSAASLDTIQVRFRTSDGTATAGDDYVDLPQTVVTFAPGEISKTVMVTVNGDLLTEPNETFFLDILDATNATVADNQAVATVLNDDGDISILPGAKRAIVIDTDGDEVIITTSKGDFEEGNFIFTPEGRLRAIDLQGDERFRGSNITVTAKLSADGDGKFDLQLVDSTGVDLGKVQIDGNLGQIVAGDGDPKKPAIKQLKVESLGAVELVIDPLLSEFRGDVGKLNVKGDVRGAAVDVQGRLGKVKIGGNLIGEMSTGAAILAAIREHGSFGPIGVGGGIPVGSFNAQSVGTFSVGEDMNGGSVTSEGDIGSVNVGQDLHSGAVAAAGRIKVLKVFRNLDSDDPSQPALVAALARVGATKPAKAVAIDTIQVRGDVENAQVLLGFRRDQTDDVISYLPQNPDASAGKIFVKGDWTASSLVAGVFDSSSDGFGRNDQLIAGDTTEEIVARIASVVIKGTASGSATDGDHFAITAQAVGKLIIDGSRIELTKGEKDNVLLDEVNGDFRLVEI